ncbi:MAG: SRPBCC family protein [Actinomycetota bacterium]|nr:SRPBCC family protein [Actinomycetota bacterium]
MAAAPDAGASTLARQRGDDGPGIQVEDIVEIRRELDHVFDFLSDGERLPAWMAGVKRAKRTSPPGGTGAGTTYRIVGKALGRRVESSYQLTAYEPGQRFSSRMESPFFRLDQAYTFRESAGVTRVTLTGKAVPLGRFKLLGPVLFVAMQRQVRADHRGLKGVLERSKGQSRTGPTRRRKVRAATEG